VDVRGAVDQAARDSYGRLLAYLASRSRDLAAADDALADAFRRALETWPRTGVPARPEAWLLTVARNRLLDAARHARVHASTLPTLVALAAEAAQLASVDDPFPDERLKLLFVCAHPAISPAIRTPLMLQAVLGLDAARIGAAFVVQPWAMGQRLSRAKAKIRDARIRFEVPPPHELASRLEAVLDAVYAVYGSGWDDLTGADPRRRDLTHESIELGRLLVQLLPAEPEARGLLALMLHCEARRDARRSADGGYVPLNEQDPRRWSTQLIDEAERHLLSASRAGRLGRYQLEAAIQSAHAQRARSGRTDWEAIALLYEGLVRVCPTLGAQVGRAAAVGEARGAAAGWQLLERLPEESVARYQPYWAVAGHLLDRLGRLDRARAAFDRAIALCEDVAVRAYLQRRAAG
jgi:RNA polymerase sigma-70 factor (ECF subfamily)